LVCPISPFSFSSLSLSRVLSKLAATDRGLAHHKFLQHFRVDEEVDLETGDDDLGVERPGQDDES